MKKLINVNNRKALITQDANIWHDIALLSTQKEQEQNKTLVTIVFKKNCTYFAFSKTNA